MNLALDCLERFSDLGFDGLAGRIEPTMPRHFLLSTAELQPSLEPRRDEIEEIAAAMGNGAWRNPEVYGQIALLARAAERGKDASSALDLLRVQLGMLRVADAPRPTDGPIRLLHVDGSIRVRHGDELDRVDNEVVASVQGLPAALLLPYPGLYRDLLGPELYPDAVECYDRTELTTKVSQAVDLLDRCSPEIASDLRHVIRTIVLTPDLHDAHQWSYNLRLGYFGAIFMNAFAVERHGLAEALMHEYFHQRLWQWWTYEPPAGLPGAVRIRSPVTHREKPATVMLQALLIYVSAHRLYTDFAADAELTPQERDWIDTRTARLSAAIPELSQALLAHIPERTTAELIVDHAMETFAAPVR